MTDEQKRKIEHRMDSTLMDGAKGSFLIREDFWRRLWFLNWRVIDSNAELDRLKTQDKEHEEINIKLRAERTELRKERDAFESALNGSQDDYDELRNEMETVVEGFVTLALALKRYADHVVGRKTITEVYQEGEAEKVKVASMICVKYQKGEKSK